MLTHIPIPIMLWTLSMMETMCAIWIVRKYSDDTNLEVALFRMPLPEIYRLQAKLFSAAMLFIAAQVLAWVY